MTPNITLNVTITTPEAAAALLQSLGVQQLSLPSAAIGPSALPPDISAVPLSAGPNFTPAAQQANTAAPIPMSPAPHTAPTASTPVYPAPINASPVAPAAINAAPPQQPTQSAVPTTAPAYTYEDLARAAAPLMDAGKINDVLTLIQSFGVQALTQLPKEQYGAFATGLRGMGARI